MTFELPQISAAYELRALQAVKLTPARFSETPDAKFPPTAGFFAHHDPAEPTLIRHLKPNTEGVLKAAELQFGPRDFITQKPGKFLKQYFSEVLSDSAIAKYAANFRAYGTPPELELALTPEAIEHVYLTGPSSCMKGPRSLWATSEKAKFHPTAIYSSPDLGVAFIKRGSAITGRCVVNRTRKTHSKIYGDIAAMKLFLSKQGFSKGNTSSLFIGALFGAYPVPNISSKQNTPVYLSSFNDHNGFYLREEIIDDTLYLRGINSSGLEPGEPKHTLTRTVTLAEIGYNHTPPKYKSFSEATAAKAAADLKSKEATATLSKKNSIRAGSLKVRASAPSPARPRQRAVG